MRLYFSFASMLLVCVSWAASVRADISPAEQAFAAGDYAKAAELAEATLAAGGLKPAQWALAQRTLGAARAYLADTERARRAFTCALALAPDLRLSNEAAVEVRSAFMEARGFWSQHPERLSASAVLSDDRLALLVTLVDPAALAARVIVRVCASGQGAFVESALPPASTVLVSLEPLAGAHRFEYSLALIDENGSRLWQLGSDAAPLEVGEQPQVVSAGPASSATATRSSSREQPAPRSPRPYYVAATISLAVAAAAGVVAGISHRERERLAERWNQARCDGAGITRGEVCQHERDQLRTKQGLAIGFYALAGAGLVAGIVTLVMAPARTRAASDARALRCDPGPGLAGVSCGASF